MMKGIQPIFQVAVRSTKSRFKGGVLCIMLPEKLNEVKEIDRLKRAVSKRQ